MDYIQQIIESVLRPDVIKATKYISNREIVRATKRLFRKKLPRKGENIEITLTFGRPNFLEREFIKDCQKAKEPFPIKKIQLKLYNPPKKKLQRKSKT